MRSRPWIPAFPLVRRNYISAYSFPSPSSSSSLSSPLSTTSTGRAWAPPLPEAQPLAEAPLVAEAPPLAEAPPVAEARGELACLRLACVSASLREVRAPNV